MSYFESLEVIMMLSGSFMALTYNIFKPEDSTTGTVFARWGWPHTLSIAVIGFYAFVFFAHASLDVCCFLLFSCWIHFVDHGFPCSILFSVYILPQF